MYVMLNEVKHLVLRSGRCFFPGMRFFVASLLRMTFSGSLSCKAAYVTILYQIVALALSTIFEDLIWNLQAVFGVLLILAGNVIALSKISTGTR